MPLKCTVEMGYSTSKYDLNFQIPYYHSLNQWLLWVTNGNQGQTVMDLWSSKTINHPQWV